MGLLKHVILPLFAVQHFIAVYLCFIQGKDETADLIGWPRSILTTMLNKTGNIVPLTVMERHLMGAWAAGNMVLFVQCVLGFVAESSHFRGVVIFSEVLFFGVDLLDAFLESCDTTALVVSFSIALVGLLVHAMEPGIFTKDKTKSD